MEKGLTQILLDYAPDFCNNSLGQEEAEQIASGFMSLRGLSLEFQLYPKRVIKDLVRFPLQSRYAYYPCNVIDLRHMLVSNTIFNEKQICLFPLGFAKRYLIGYPLFLAIDKSEIKEFFDATALLVCGNSIPNARNLIKRISVSSELSPDEITSVNRIVAEECPNIDLDILNDIPAVREPHIPVLSKSYNYMKFAQTEQHNEISLTPQEQEIFDLILNCKRQNQQTANVELRVAGGWVRDKLLGQASDDIDIAISHMSGIEFARIMSQCGKSQGQQNISDAYEVSLEKSSETDKDAKNPQLFVGGIKINGMKIEFVPMRTETYTKDSRTPQIQRTDDVQEDVVRRDLTINALYYNIETRQVEDYVGGINDLKTMTLRTPVDPVKTFQDDPLRMMRVLRFYSKFPNSKIDQSVLDALANPEVQEFYSKLAPERASKEFIKLMEGARPHDAIRILFETGLYKKVLNVDPSLQDIQMDQKNENHTFNLMNHILAVMKNLNEISEKNNLPTQERAWLNLAAFFHDFGKMYPEIQTEHPKKPGQMQYLGHEDKSFEFAHSAMKRMGFDKQVKDFVLPVVRNHMWTRFLDAGTPPKTLNKQIGKLLHDVDALYDKIVYHGQADFLAKGEKTPEELESTSKQTAENIEYIRQYREQMGNRVSKTVIDGNRVRELITQYAPELVQNNAQFDENGKLVNYMSHVIHVLLEQQWKRRIETPEQAEKFIRDSAKSWVDQWKHQMKKRETSPDKQSFNLGKMKKEAYGNWWTTESGISEWVEKEREIKRTQDGAVSPFQVGDKVRLRSSGLAFKQIEGRVIEVRNNTMVVEFINGKHKGETVRVNLTDARNLALTWGKA
jgi:tRNA nucleotidyltransferase/poly(A) polymerase